MNQGRRRKKVNFLPADPQNFVKTAHTGEPLFAELFIIINPPKMFYSHLKDTLSKVVFLFFFKTISSQYTNYIIALHRFCRGEFAGSSETTHLCVSSKDKPIDCQCKRTVKEKPPDKKDMVSASQNVFDFVFVGDISVL